jgi:hypothetical protein
MSAHEKAAWMLDTSEAAQETQRPGSLPTAQEISNDPSKVYTTLRAKFALRGYALTRSHHLPFGGITYILERWNFQRAFTDLVDLQQYFDTSMEAALWPIV